MADEKLFRIEWNDELWTELGSVFLDHVQMPEEKSVERVDMEDSFQQEAVVENFSVSSNVIPVSLQKVYENIAESENASIPVSMKHIQGTQKKDPVAFDHNDSQFDFMSAIPSPSVILGDNSVMHGVETDSFSLSYVQSPVNLAKIGNLSSFQRQSMTEVDSGVLSDNFFTENGRALGQRLIPEQKENNMLALQQTVRQVVKEKLSELKVYVLESDITDAQQAVKAVVKQATF